MKELTLKSKKKKKKGKVGHCTTKHLSPFVLGMMNG